MSYLITKRILDVIFSLLFLIILSPLFIIFCLSIYFTSGNPVIFTQRRIGSNRKEFKIYKFRTMRRNALEMEKRGVPKEKLMTRLGKFARFTHIDELPQLINILKGDMSFVGYRPIDAKSYKKIEKSIDGNPNLKKIYRIKPGLTGLRSILTYMNEKGRRKTFSKFGLHDDWWTDDPEIPCNINLYYVNNVSLTLDLKIIYWTFSTLLGKIKRRSK